jgi:hypothetical protein
VFLTQKIKIKRFAHLSQDTRVILRAFGVLAAKSHKSSLTELCRAKHVAKILDFC